MALKDYDGRICKEQCSFDDSRLQDWFRMIEFKEGEGFSMFILRYGS
jgi:hypothetical protein